MEEKSIQAIAVMHSQFPDKFGIPRQSGLADALEGRVVLEPEFRTPDALRGIEGFSHLWLIWGFHKAWRETWSATVRPPRLGGNERLGVFATRSPFRPNGLGLSCVRLEQVEWDTPQGPVLHVRGADLMDGTPIYDIKPYLPYADAYPQAAQGFAPAPEGRLAVELDPGVGEELPAQTREALVQVLAWDPRPHYHSDPGRVYGMRFAGLEVKFTVDGERLRVHEIGEEG